MSAVRSLPPAEGKLPNPQPWPPCWLAETFSSRRWAAVALLGFHKLHRPLLLQEEHLFDADLRDMAERTQKQERAALAILGARCAAPRFARAVYAARWRRAALCCGSHEHSIGRQAGGTVEPAV